MADTTDPKRPTPRPRRPKQMLGQPHSKHATGKRAQQSHTEQALICQVAQDIPEGALTAKKLLALCELFDRKPETIKQLIATARHKLIAASEFYVDAHQKATETALAKGNVEWAQKGAQWALEHISIDGHRIVEKPTQEQVGRQVLIGIKIGGIDESKLVTDVAADGA